MADLDDAIALLRTGDWQAAHLIVQADESELAAWGHAIVHLMEGDEANAAYWFERASRPVRSTDAVASEIEALAAACSNAARDDRNSHDDRPDDKDKPDST